MSHFAVLEIRRDDLGIPVEHIWHDRMSGRPMSERQAHELRTMLAAQATTTATTSRSSYRVCAWADATQYKEAHP